MTEIDKASNKEMSKNDGTDNEKMAEMDEISLEEVAYSEAVELNKPNKTRLDDPRNTAPGDSPEMTEAGQGDLPQRMDSDQPGEGGSAVPMV